MPASGGRGNFQQTEMSLGQGQVKTLVRPGLAVNLGGGSVVGVLALRALRPRRAGELK